MYDDMLRYVEWAVKDDTKSVDTENTENKQESTEQENLERRDQRRTRQTHVDSAFFAPLSFPLCDLCVDALGFTVPGLRSRVYGPGFTLSCLRCREERNAELRSLR